MGNIEVKAPKFKNIIVFNCHVSTSSNCDEHRNYFVQVGHLQRINRYIQRQVELGTECNHSLKESIINKTVVMGSTVSILQAHIASTSSASSIKTEGVEDDAVLCLIELYTLTYSDWVMNPIIVSSTSKQLILLCFVLSH